jgi:hypothetical protein
VVAGAIFLDTGDIVYGIAKFVLQRWCGVEALLRRQGDGFNDT